MRRFIGSLSALGLLTLALGCCHTAGVCDCDNCACAGCNVYNVPPVGAPIGKPLPAAKPETLKEMPKEKKELEEQAN